MPLRRKRKQVTVAKPPAAAVAAAPRLVPNLVNRKDIYLSAMTGADGSINPGYLVLFRSGRATIIVCAAMTIGAIVQTSFDPRHVFPFEDLGKGIGLVLAAYGLLLGGIATFLWGDSKQTATAGSATTTVATPSGTSITTSEVK